MESDQSSARGWGCARARLIAAAIAFLTLISFGAPASATESSEEFTKRLMQSLLDHVHSNYALCVADRDSALGTLIVTFALSADGSVSSAKVTDSPFASGMNHLVEREMSKMPNLPEMPEWAVGKRYSLPLLFGARKSSTTTPEAQ